MKNNVLNVNEKDLSLMFPKLPDRANKGSMGRVLCICGSYDGRGLSMCGAAYFAAMAAYRCGAGIVEIFTPRKNYESLAALVPEAVFSLYEYEENEADVCARLLESIKRASSTVLGCGIGKSDMSRAIVDCVLKNVNCPLLIDADGLNLISENMSVLNSLDVEQRKRTVITPHPGEMMRLCGKSIAEILDSTVETALEMSKKNGVVCLLKDHNTVITDGELVYINQSGNAGMATAGMGDVLAGMIGALLARSRRDGDVIRAAASGAYLHGLAGDIAAEKTGMYSLTASDVLSQISMVIPR